MFTLVELFFYQERTTDKFNWSQYRPAFFASTKRKN